MIQGKKVFHFEGLRGLTLIEILALWDIRDKGIIQALNNGIGRFDHCIHNIMALGQFNVLLDGF